jgi:hypothetical protein
MVVIGDGFDFEGTVSGEVDAKEVISPTGEGVERADERVGEMGFRQLLVRDQMEIAVEADGAGDWGEHGNALRLNIQHPTANIQPRITPSPYETHSAPGCVFLVDDSGIHGVSRRGG